MDLTEWIGVPYGGKRFCAVFVARYLAQHGIPYPLTARRPTDAPEWVRVERPQALDVVVFNREGRPGHVGVCVGGGRFLHVEEDDTSCTDRLSSPIWRPRIEGFYRYSP